MASTTTSPPSKLSHRSHGGFGTATNPNNAVSDSTAAATVPLMMHGAPHLSPPSTPLLRGGGPSLWNEFVQSADLLFQNRLSWMLALGPLAIVGDSTGSLGEALCFCFAGIALIPCAERLSFITEQVAEHTNGTIGALLNATFGNAPELLISVSALRAGYYRVVQLAMLGSMLTNMLLVFGLACLIGGMRWQVQELRIVSGNVNVVMLLLATSGSLFPAALKLSGQLSHPSTANWIADDDSFATPEEVKFCRVNASVMLTLYVLFLVFQMGTHKEEYDDDYIVTPSRRARRNLFCLGMYQNALKPWRLLWNLPPPPPIATYATLQRQYSSMSGDDYHRHPAQQQQHYLDHTPYGQTPHSSNGGRNTTTRSDSLVEDMDAALNASDDSWNTHPDADELVGSPTNPSESSTPVTIPQPVSKRRRPVDVETGGGIAGKRDFHKTTMPDNHNMSSLMDDDRLHPDPVDAHATEAPVLSLRVGVVWLFIITLCISAMTDILVDTIDGFAHRMHISEVFTSMVVIPFFSNVAEQVSAFLFAYRNEMDLCIGVTVGSAIQIATFVLPGSVLIGMFMDRSMTLFFHGFETTCLFFGVVVVGAILQGGTTNWMTGALLVGIYIVFASGIWFHEQENLTIDAEDMIRNATTTMAAAAAAAAARANRK